MRPAARAAQVGCALTDPFFLVTALPAVTTTERVTVTHRTTTTDLIQTIKLVDESCPEGVALCIFAKEADTMPRAVLGDVLELRNVVVSEGTDCCACLLCWTQKLASFETPAAQHSTRYGTLRPSTLPTPLTTTAAHAWPVPLTCAGPVLARPATAVCKDVQAALLWVPAVPPQWQRGSSQ
jgi:hypothetical protein